jgi:glyoxylase-like metal-dependent hydrolase (beta-lactamase superfamily II)
VTVLSRGLSWIDLKFRDRPHAIATAVIDGGGTLGLVDPGPSTCLETLELGLQQQGLRLGDVTHLLLTHIHLDHAGATGTIVRRYPHVAVLVHERGAVHMADPAKLLASAARLYGDQMDILWGEVAPVPQQNLVALRGGEQLDVGGRTFDVAYTPGHASHHVSYFDPASGVAFVGDTAGICIDSGYVLPPTPPPDIDIELWTASVARIEAWSPRTLFLTHFGPAPSVRPHLQAVLHNLDTLAGFVHALLGQPGSDHEQSVGFAEMLRRELRGQMTGTQLDSYDLAAPFEQLWLGLARYWRKRSA